MVDSSSFSNHGRWNDINQIFVIFMFYFNTIFYTDLYIYPFISNSIWLDSQILELDYRYSIHIDSKFQIYHREIKIYYYLNQKLNNIYININISHKAYKRIYQIHHFITFQFNVLFTQHPLTILFGPWHSHYNRSIFAVILLERNRIHIECKIEIRISMKWNDLVRGIIRWTGIRKLSCIWLSMRAIRLNGRGLFRLVGFRA